MILDTLKLFQIFLYKDEDLNNNYHNFNNNILFQEVNIFKFNYNKKNIVSKQFLTRDLSLFQKDKNIK